MLYSYEKMLLIYKVLIFIVFIFFIIDCFLTFSIKKTNAQINNRYYDLQRNYGFAGATAFKFIVVLCLSYLLLNPPGNAGAVGAIAVVYCLIVIIFFVDALKAIRSTKINPAHKK